MKQHLLECSCMLGLISLLMLVALCFILEFCSRVYHWAAGLFGANDTQKATNKGNDNSY